MLNVILLALNLSVLSAPSSDCETVTRHDDIKVEICAGSVVSWTDAQGNVLRPRDWR